MKIGRDLSNSLLRRAIINPALAGFSRPTLTPRLACSYSGIGWSLFLQRFALFLQFRALFSFGKN
jgi:hypothetical protein